MKGFSRKETLAGYCDIAARLGQVETLTRPGQEREVRRHGMDHADFNTTTTPAGIYWTISFHGGVMTQLIILANNNGRHRDASFAAG
jgi:hypothetical protein